MSPEMGLPSFNPVEWAGSGAKRRVHAQTINGKVYSVSRQKSMRAPLLALVAVVVFWAQAVMAQAQQTPTSPTQRGGGLAERLRDRLGGQGNLGQGNRDPNSPNGQENQNRTGRFGDRDKSPENPGAAASDGDEKPGGAPAAPAQPSQPSAGGGTAVQMITGGEGNAAGAVTVSTGAKGFEPYKSLPLEYGKIPDLDEEITLSEAGPMNVNEFLDVLSQATSWNIMASKAVEQVSLRFWVTEITPQQALEILKFNDVYYEFNPETKLFSVMTKDEHLEKTHATVLLEREFNVKFANLTDVQSMIESLMSPQGRMITDARSSKLIVWDTKDNLKYMERALAEVDLDRQSRTFELTHVNADALTDSITALISETGEVQVDPRTNKFMIVDHPANVARVAKMVEALDLPLETRTWILNYADPEIVSEQVATLVPEEMGAITVNEDVHQITVTAIPSRMDDIDKLVQMWDVRRKQVQIEAYLVTASSEVARNLGVNWSYFGKVAEDLVGFQVGNQTPDFAAFPEAGQRMSIGQLPRAILRTGADGETQEDLLGDDLIRNFAGGDVSAVLDYLETEGDVTIMAHPRITVQDGEEAVFENTTQVPFSQSTADRPVRDIDPTGGFNTSFRSVSRIEFIDVGTILRVMPRIAEEGNILLDISAEDSSFKIVTVTGADQENDVPQKSQNLAETQVMVHDNDTLIIGGLRVSNVSDQAEKIPVLGDIPLLGRLFKSTTKNRSHRDLLVFITTTIVDEKTQPEAMRLAQLDQGVAGKLRYDEKNAFERIAGRLSDGRDEILVSIGQSGDYFHEDKTIALAELRTLFFSAPQGASRKVIALVHPRAPESALMELREIALEADLKLELDESARPFVPPLVPPVEATAPR